MNDKEGAGIVGLALAPIMTLPPRGGGEHSNKWNMYKNISGK